VVAQAKINLFLRILARAVDGYHSIETLFLRLELGDVVRVRVGGSTRTLVCHGPTSPFAGIGPADQNLAYRAAIAYADAAGWPSGFSIDLEKLIPVGGGLGGGSADAGAVLRALDALAAEPMGAEALQRLAVGLGADVPFLASDSACGLAWGRGERLLDVPPPPQLPVELLVPGFAVSTKSAYEDFAASHSEYEPRATRHRVSDLSSWPHLAAIAGNDLEPTVGARHPEILACVAALRERGTRIAMMSGSGSAVFGVFEHGGTPAPDRRRGAHDRLPANVSRLYTRTSTRVAGVELID
jgi:4-diphosphocytidyl-2-C-methyl-D-erythritol kinase